MKDDMGQGYNLHDNNKMQFVERKSKDNCC